MQTTPIPYNQVKTGDVLFLKKFEKEPAGPQVVHSVISHSNNLFEVILDPEDKPGQWCTYWGYGDRMLNLVSTNTQ